MTPTAQHQRRQERQFPAAHGDGTGQRDRARQQAERQGAIRPRLVNGLGPPEPAHEPPPAGDIITLRSIALPLLHRATRRVAKPACPPHTRGHCGIQRTMTTRRRRPLGSKMRRELVYFGLIAGFGLVVLPFLVYLAGVLSLGPYEGGLAGLSRIPVRGLLHASAECVGAAAGTVPPVLGGPPADPADPTLQGAQLAALPAGPAPQPARQVTAFAPPHPATCGLRLAAESGSGGHLAPGSLTGQPAP